MLASGDPGNSSIEKLIKEGVRRKRSPRSGTLIAPDFFADLFLPWDVLFIGVGRGWVMFV